MELYIEYHNQHKLPQYLLFWKDLMVCCTVLIYLLHHGNKVAIAFEDDSFDSTVIHPVESSDDFFIEGWMPRDIQLDDPRTAKEIAEADAQSAGYDRAQAEKQLARAMEAFKSGRRRGEPKLRQPANWGHQYPGNIFNGMIHPVRPYAIRGAIWYQGERNAKHVAQAIDEALASYPSGS